MNLDFFNNLGNALKENKIVQNFMNELSNYLEKVNNDLANQNSNNVKTNSLKQENTIYQVVEIDVDGVYLQNTMNNKISKETDIPKELLKKIGNDTVLKYKDGKYIIEEELTQKFLDNLVGIKELEKIQEDFKNNTNILNIDSNTVYQIETKNNSKSILSYENNEKKRIEVPNELIPFWAKDGEKLIYQDGIFERKKSWLKKE